MEHGIASELQIFAIAVSDGTRKDGERRTKIGAPKSVVSKG